MSSEEQQVPLTPAENALAGALGGVFANAVTYPLDTVKARVQAGGRRPPSTNGAPQPPPVITKNTTLFRGVFLLARSEGFRVLYKGFGANMVNTFLMQFAYFYAYANVRRIYFRTILRIPRGTKRPVLSTAAELLLGALAGAIAQLFTIPVNVIATRQQLGAAPLPSSPRTYKLEHEQVAKGPIGWAQHKAKSLWLEIVHDEESIVGVTRDIYREDGITGFWRGFKASLVLCSNPAITYGVFERCKNLVISASGDHKMTPAKSFIVGALSKSLATVVTFPYILAKIRLQARSAEYDSALYMLAHIVRTQGVQGMYQGMSAQITKSVLSQALLFFARDYFEIWTRALLAITGTKK